MTKGTASVAWECVCIVTPFSRATRKRNKNGFFLKKIGKLFVVVLHVRNLANGWYVKQDPRIIIVKIVRWFFFFVF